MQPSVLVQKVVRFKNHARILTWVRRSTVTVFACIGTFEAVAAWFAPSNGVANSLVELLPGCLVLMVLAFASSLLDKGPRWRAWLMLSSGSALTVLCLFALPELVGAGTDALSGRHAGGGDFRILTQNVWNEVPVQGDFYKVLEKSGADIIALQEGVGVVRKATVPLRAEYPYEWTCPAPWGCDTVILSKRRFLSEGVVSSKTNDYPPISWVKTLSSQGVEMGFVSIHAPRPEHRLAREEQFRQLRRLVTALGRDHTIVAGDFNSSGFGPDIRRLDKTLLPLMRQDHGLLTWPAAVANRALRLPIQTLGLDHIFAGPGWQKVNLHKFTATRSDHLGLLLTLHERRSK